MAQHDHGFTLIELLIVVTLSVVLLLTASTLFATLLIGNTKTTSSTLVKQEGSAALSQIEFLLRNATDVPTCTSTSMSIKSLDGGTTIIAAQQDASDSRYKIASNSARFLTSGSVELVGNTINVSCSQSSGLAKYVTFSFTLRKGQPGVDQAREIVEQTFSSAVSIRSQ